VKSSGDYLAENKKPPEDFYFRRFYQRYSEEVDG